MTGLELLLLSFLIFCAVGAGVTSLLFFLTLRKINALKGMERDEE